MAEKCFLRALQLDNQLVEPRVALAIMKLNTGDLNEVQPAMKLLQEAYAIDSKHPRVLNFFADHYTYRKEYGKVEKLAHLAKQNSDSPFILSESAYHLGRVNHAQGRFDAAFEHYQDSVKKNPENMLAQFGLAQMHIHQGHPERAIPCLETVLKRYPEDFATLQMIGTLNARKGNATEARELLQRAVDAETTDPDTLSEFAQLLEKKEPGKSLIAYRAALKLLVTKGDDDSRIDGLRNNVGVMHHHLGHHQEALASYMELFGGKVESYENAVEKSVTSCFNLARLYEDMDNLDEAVNCYEAILKKHVTYVACYLRLASISRKKGDTEAAMAHLQDALTVHTDLPDALALMGNIHMEKREYHAAQRKFERILEKSNSRDPYALISLGNMYYMARSERKEKKDSYMKYAADSYLMVLKHDNNNLYAANGIGMIFAEEGRLGAAGDIFTGVREGTNAMPDVLVNLAHIYVARGDFQKAITLYENAMRKYYKNNHPKLNLYLSKAHFEAHEYDQAQQYLRKCMEIWPEKKTLKFNLALISEAKAAQVLEKAQSLSLSVAEEAVTAVREARALFEELSVRESNEEDEEDDDKDSEQAMLRKNSETHLLKCTDLARQAEQALEKARELHSEEENQQRQRAEKIKERMRQREEEEKRKREEEEKKAQELAEIAQREILVLREEMVHWKPLEEKTRQPGSSGKRRRSTRVASRRDSDDEELYEAPTMKKTTLSSSGNEDMGTQAPMEEDVDEDDDDGELEDWQKEMMVPKMQELLNSKRVRDDREKRGGMSKRSRNTDE